MSKSAEEGTEKKKVELDETGEKLGNLSRRRRDWREKRWGEEMGNIRQGTKEVGSVTEQENTVGQLLLEGRSRDRLYLEEWQKHLW